MCILATSSFIIGATKVAQRCVRAFFMPKYAHHSGAQPRKLVVMANLAPIMKLDNGKWAPSFFACKSKS